VTLTTIRALRNWLDSRSLVTKAVTASIVLSVLVAGAFVVLLVTLSDLQSSTNVQTRSRNATTATLQLQQVVNQLESSLRGYIVSGNRRFLEPWHQGRHQLGPALTNLDELLQHEPAEKRQSDELATLIHGYVLEYGLPLIRILGLSPTAARSADATREGDIRITSIRSRLDRLLATEGAQAASDAFSAQHEANRAVPIAAGALAAAVGLLLLYGLFLARRIGDPVGRVADGAGQIAAGDLSTRLPERGAAEIRTLTQAFNAMAASLEQGQRDLERQNEKLRQSERLKSQLISIVSHELRTPLSSILGYTSLLRTRDFDKPDRDRYLEIIQEQGNRLTQLIDQFLDGESIDSGRIELEDSPVDLRPVIMEEVRLMGDKSAKHRLEVVMGAAALPVRGDRGRLAQVFANLLENAVKYSPDGGVVEVLGEAAAGVVHVEVRDEGIGVPEEHQSRIFTKFFRADARESGIAGTGLGLAISREIVEAHAGRMGFTSTAGVGSRFWFELPLAVDRTPVEATTEAATV
jgi:signal transduction histidine kinase